MPEATIEAIVDRVTLPGTIHGWAIRRVAGALAGGLRIEVKRGDRLIAAGEPRIPRPDVTNDPDHPAGFVIECGPELEAQALLEGALSITVVDEAGTALPVPLWEHARATLREELTLHALRGADPARVQAMAEALQANPSLSSSARQALAGRRVVAGRVARTPKIVFIGAGSTVFAKNLLGDILLHPALAAARIWLYDIDAERLRVSEIVANRIRQTLDAPATITATRDLGAALDGADYAITMIQVGGYQPCTVTDFEVPKRFGLRQTIADTLGIGGIMRALRTIPVLLEMAREMERRCPDVLHLNYANPMAMNCWALSRASRIRTVGLCHSVPHTAGELAADLGLPPEAIDYQVAGINHMAFYLKLEAGGEDLYPRLHQVIAEGRVPPGNRVRYEVMRHLGYFVTESSEHFAEYVPWFIKRGQESLIDRYNIPLDEYPRRCELQIAEWTRLSRTLTDPTVPLQVTRSQEYGARIIDAVETGTPCVIYGNVPNAGLITNLPEGCCVEVPCLVDHNGVQPVRIGALPPQLAALMQTNVNVQALTVEDALTGRRDHVLHAAMLDPHTAAELSLEDIARLVDAMLEAHRDWLPPALRAG